MAENKMTKEVLKAAKGTGSVEELQKLAKENGMELDAAQAEEMYARLHPVTQELSDDELDNVTGGDSCDVGYSCPKCGSTEASSREPLYGCTYVTCACCGATSSTTAIFMIPCRDHPADLRPPVPSGRRARPRGGLSWILSAFPLAMCWNSSMDS